MTPDLEDASAGRGAFSIFTDLYRSRLVRLGGCGFALGFLVLPITDWLLWRTMPHTADGPAKYTGYPWGSWQCTVLLIVFGMFMLSFVVLAAGFLGVIVEHKREGRACPPRRSRAGSV